LSLVSISSVDAGVGDRLGM